MLKKLLLTASILSLSSIGLYYYLLKKNEYIVDPNDPLYTQFEWTTWKDSAGGRMANDPKWLAMVPDKYIPKEVPFEFTFMEKIQPAYKRRIKYFNHLCETEMISYMRNDYPEDMKNSRYHLETNTFIYINRGEFPVKGMQQLYDIAESENERREKREEAKNQIKNIWTIKQQNPYYYSIRLGGIPILKEGEVYDLMLAKVNEDYYEKHKSLPLKSTFREYLDNDGYVWRARYDDNIKQFLPIEKDRTIKAQYNDFSKKSQNYEMKKLGIWKVENFNIDIYNQKIMAYSKTFVMPAYLFSLRDSNFKLPIDWNKKIYCSDNYLSNRKYIIK